MASRLNFASLSHLWNLSPNFSSQSAFTTGLTHLLFLHTSTLPVTPTQVPKNADNLIRASGTDAPGISYVRAAADAPLTTVKRAPLRDVYILIKNSTADFDSIATAVGLSKLLSPHTLVLIPVVEGPSLLRFLTH